MIDRDKGSYDPCVGCGYCCLSAPCTAAVLENGRCIMLFWSAHKERYLCSKAILHPEFFKEMHMGEGCCSNLNTWRKEVRWRG